MPFKYKMAVNMPLLALRGMVVFPNSSVSFEVARKKSIEALNAAMNSGRLIFLVTQHDIADQEPTPEKLYDIGCIARVKQILKMPGNNIRAVVEGVSRAQRFEITSSEPYLRANVAEIAEYSPKLSEIKKEALLRNAVAVFEDYAKVAPKMPPDVLMSVISQKDIGKLADFIAANIPVITDDKQFILEEVNLVKRLKSVVTLLKKEKEIINIDKSIAEKVKVNIDQNQREYYLREQAKVINEELYGEEDPQLEADRYYELINKLNAPDSVKEKLSAEVARYAKMPSGAHEATVVLNYLDTCLSLPWGIFSKDKIDLKKAQKILDANHYGLDKVKKRIIELLAVHSLTNSTGGQIICLVGPPGVGKTSIAKAIADCMGRKYVRIALGGITDEAEIRGHRRTYIGAMPGRIISALKNAGTSNPLLLLDEIDKVGASHKGDPASALLEALDGEQNNTFNDRYVDMPFDLSKVLFVVTANDASTIPAPLLDRMELINIQSYTREEKFNIASKHLIKKQIAKNGLTKQNCNFTKDAIYKLIDSYTREAGVRQLDREIASVCRKVATMVVGKEANKVTVNAQKVKELLGVEKFKPDLVSKKDEVGVVNGLAWTSVGGEIMPLEVLCVKGTGQLILTGSLGDVMQESAKTAVSYVRSRAEDFGIDTDFYKNLDIHINATEAAIPKDGPSAGVTMATALVSALTGIPVRCDVAMTGEITLRGRSLAIGGLSEKSMAAYKSGVKTVFIPEANIPNLEEVQAVVKENVTFIPVSNVDEILKIALIRYPTASNSQIADASFGNTYTTQATMHSKEV